LTAQGRDEEAVGIYTALAAANPYDESATERLMTALDAAGRTNEALAVFAAFRERLRDELGTSPGARIAGLNTRLLRADAEQSAPRVRIGLRSAPNELLGREGDVAEVARLLKTNRVVTILGAGGLGKTRLAQAAAAASDSPVVAFVPLASVRSDVDVPGAVAGVLGITEASGAGLLAESWQRPELRGRLIATLAERPTLLVLDNCEQVVDGVAAWTSDLLGAVPSLTVLTTSRTALAIAGEAVHPLPPLGAEDGEGPAVRLFLERARAVRPGADLPLDVVTRICTHLDGLPLAIELAAARVRTMTPAQIEERLRDRFALLTTGDRSAPERHRTLEAVIAWSWDLLDDHARWALARLSVLPAGFSAVTAEGVLGQPVDDILDRLVSQSLLMVTDDAEGVRFRMLETVREYCLARLDDPRDGEDATDSTEQAWDAVFEWMRRLAVDHVPDILDPQAFTTTRAEHDNLLAALRRAIDLGRDPDIVLSFSLLAPGWMVRGQFSEMIALVAQALVAAQRLVQTEQSTERPAVPADALVITLTIGAAAAQYGDTSASLRPLVLLRRVRTRPGISPTLAAVAEIVSAAPSVEELHAVVDRLRASEEPEHRLVAELALAQFAENDGAPDVSLAANRRAWELANRRGAVWIAAMAASGVGQLASQSARPTEALVWLDRADEGFRAFGLGDGMQELGWMRAGSLLSLGRIEEARALFTELAERRELTPDGQELTSVGWFGLAEVTRVEGRADEAAVAYRHAMKQFSGKLQRASPWYLLAMAGFLSAGAMDGMLPADELAVLARRLRTRALAIGRMQGFVDKPVLGSVLAGVSAWALTLDAGAAIGVELLGLAESLGARQDLPSLRLADHFALAAEIVGEEEMQKARDAASGLSPDDRVTRARALLSDQALRI
jgi:predicted ATPase